jgi:hypothetical protein
LKRRAAGRGRIGAPIHAPIEELAMDLLEKHTEAMLNRPADLESAFNWQMGVMASVVEAIGSVRSAGVAAAAQRFGWDQATLEEFAKNSPPVAGAIARAWRRNITGSNWWMLFTRMAPGR